MSPENFTISPDEIKEIYDELDLTEEGITDDEVTRRKRRIFVGGLRFGSEDHVLHDHFAKFGEIKEAVVIRDRRNGLSKGYGFVTMIEDIPALKAIVDKSPKLDGRRCNVNLAYIGQKKKPPSKRGDVRDMHISPQQPQYFNPANGFLYSPTYSPNAVYQLGLPPLHGYQPFYHLPPTPSPVYEARDSYQHQSAVSPYQHQQTVFFPQPVMFNPQPNNNNNYAYSPSPVSPEVNNNNNIDTNNNNSNNNNETTVIHSATSPVTTPIVSFTNLTLNHQQQPPPDIVPISSQSVTNVTVNGNFQHDMRSIIVNGKQQALNNNTIVLNEQVLSPYHLGMNNNLPQTNGHLLNGNTGHLLNGNHVMNGQNSVTTFVTSPLPSPTVQNHQLFQYQAQQFIPHREIVQN